MGGVISWLQYGDQSRIAANVASGVGFIGAGVITQNSAKDNPKQG